MKNLQSAPKILGAVILGAIAGTVLGILLAPHKGTKTREKIVGNAKKMAKDLNKNVTDEVHTLKNKAEKLQKRAEEKFMELKNGLLN